jgi:predicted transcriptional regulator/GGDEF domain-containing protein
LLRKPAFLARLQNELAGRGATSCVVAQLDDCGELETLYGRSAAAALRSELIQRAGKQCDPKQGLALLDGQRLAVIVSGGAEEAVAWAETLRASAADEFLVGEQRLSLSISCGVAAGGPKVAAAELLEKAEQALELAQQSGGNFVAGHADYLAHAKRWSELAAGGKLLESAVIRNIMIPCTLLLRTQDSLRQVEALFRQTQLRALPVVDDEGKLAGLVSASNLREHTLSLDATQRSVEEIMDRDIASFDEQTSLAAVIDYFAQEALVIVIVNKGRPTGLVTPHSLATLVQRLTTETFAPTADARGSAGLRVPNLCGVDGGDPRDAE